VITSNQFPGLTSARSLRLDSFRITVHRHTNSKDTRRKNRIRFAFDVERNNTTMARVVLIYLRSRKSLLSKFKIHKQSINAGYRYCYPILKSTPLQNYASCDLNLVYKSLNHRVKHNKFTLSLRDVEKNPGPYPYTVIDPNKTISVLYSQGNNALFG